MSSSDLRPRWQPVVSESVWLHQPVLPCPEHPAGLAGFCIIESQTKRKIVADHYLVTPHLDSAGQVTGWRFARGTVEGDICHDIDISLELGPACDCGDALFRHRPFGCKHMQALTTMRPVVLPAAPPFRSSAQAAEHLDPLTRAEFDAEVA